MNFVERNRRPQGRPRRWKRVAAEIKKPNRASPTTCKRHTLLRPVWRLQSAEPACLGIAQLSIENRRLECRCVDRNLLRFSISAASRLFPATSRSTAVAPSDFAVSVGRHCPGFSRNSGKVAPQFSRASFPWRRLSVLWTIAAKRRSIGIPPRHAEPAPKTTATNLKQNDKHGEFQYHRAFSTKTGWIDRAGLQGRGPKVAIFATASNHEGPISSVPILTPGYQSRPFAETTISFAKSAEQRGDRTSLGPERLSRRPRLENPRSAPRTSPLHDPTRSSAERNGPHCPSRPAPVPQRHRPGPPAASAQGSPIRRHRDLGIGVRVVHHHEQRCRVE